MPHASHLSFILGYLGYCQLKHVRKPDCPIATLSGPSGESCMLILPCYVAGTIIFFSVWKGVEMTVLEIIGLLKVTLWPAVAVIALWVVRPHIGVLLSGSRVRFSMAGQVIETTLPELEQVFEEQSCGRLSEDHVEYLKSLKKEGTRHYPNGVKGEDRSFLRPLRNTGLVITVPRDSFLQDVSAVELSGLGRMYLRGTPVKDAKASR